MPPASIAFTFGPQGKPFLSDNFRSNHIEFNLAHSDGVGLFAISRGRPVGVDIEAIRPLQETEQIIRRFFSLKEQAEYLALGMRERLPAFYRAWTRKEAYLKVIGTGLATLLDSFDVSLRPCEPPALTRVGDDPEEASRWTLVDLPVGDEHAAALATKGILLDQSLHLRDGDPWLTRTVMPRSD
ncbi:MAG: hypothetical protein NVSMB9_13310 [Isosphaeraceae bacterium]